jgi:hypothetical protein
LAGSSRFTAGAVWEDAKLGVARLWHWERIAVVGDAVWLGRAIRRLGWAMPRGEIRLYAFDRFDEARAWVTSPRRVSSARRFFADVSLAFRVLNHMRHRAMKAAFGAQQGWQSNLVTVILIASTVDGIHRVISAPRERVRKARFSPYAAADAMLAAAVLNEAIDKVTIRRAKATASTAALIVFALVVHAIRPTVKKALHAVRTTLRDLISEVRKVRDAIGHYGAQIAGISATDDAGPSPSVADSNE